MKDEISSFVGTSLERGLERSEIAEALAAAGWPQDQIRTALAEYAEVDFPVPVPKAKSYVSAKEAFTFLVLFSALYASAVSFVNLAFETIMGLLPEAEALSRYAFSGRVRWYIATLLVALPVFFALSVWTNRAIDADPAKRTSKVRKWLTYLTLFLAAIALAADLITLLSYFLDGDVSLRFLLKVAVVAAVTTLILTHYLAELRNADEAAAVVSSKRRLAAGTAAAMVLALLCSTFWLGASPWYASKARHDEGRIEDLQAIAAAIEKRWKDGGRVPEDLKTFAGQRGVSLRRIEDPTTRRLYGFRRLGPTAIELCAVFETAEPIRNRPSYRFSDVRRERFWEHSEGRTCFLIEDSSNTPAPSLPAGEADPPLGKG